MKRKSKRYRWNESISYPEKVEEYIPTFYKIRYILEELYVAVLWIISQLIIYIDQMNADDISTIDTLSGVPGVSKNSKDPTKDPFCELFYPKLNRIWKTFRKQGFFVNFCSILTVFHSFFNFGWILVLELTRVDFSWSSASFDTPGGASIVEWNKFWSLRSLCKTFMQNRLLISIF